MIYKFEDWAKDKGEAASYWVKDKFYYPIRKASDDAFKLYLKENTKIMELKKELPSGASRRIHIYAIAQEPLNPYTKETGLDVLKKNGITPDKVPELSPKELDAYKQLRAMFEKFFPLVNEGRAAAGLRPFGKLTNYFTHAKDLSISEQLGIGFKDSEFTSPYTHPKGPAFPYAEHRYKTDMPLLFDAFGLADKYAHVAVRHMLISPAIAQVREYLGKFTYKDSAGKTKTWKMADELPVAHKELTQYLDFASGKVLDTVIPKELQYVMHTLAKHSNIAVLAGSVTSVITQSTALMQTVIQFGLPYTLQGIAGLVTKARIEALRESEHLASRLQDVSIVAMGTGAVGKVSKIRERLVNSWLVGLKALKFIDEEAATATRITAKLYFADQGLTGEKLKRYADDYVVKTQGSAAPYDVAPIQRYPVGKYITNLQTFVIANWNWMQKDVLGIRNPRVPTTKMFKYLVRYLFWSTVLGALYELGNKEAPFGAPVIAGYKMYKELQGKKGKGLSDFRKAAKITGATVVEAAQIVPWLGNMRFGSGMLGLPTDTMKWLSEKISAEYGIGKGNTRSWLELGGRLTGVPRTGQTAREFRILRQGGTLTQAVLGAYPEESVRTRASKERRSKARGDTNSLRNLMKRYRPKLERPQRPY